MNTTLYIHQVWFNYFVAYFFKTVSTQFSREAMEKDAPIDSAFSPVSFWSMGVITPVCQSFGVLPENLAT